jgi:phosphate transport system protein
MERMMTDHTVTSFDVELRQLAKLVVEMGGIAETMLAEAVDALRRRDIRMAQNVIIADGRLDQLQREIEELSVTMIAKRQPMAVDLRDIVAAMRIASDLERAGDLAKNIGKRVVAMSGAMSPPKAVGGLVHMSQLVLNQFKTVLDSYTQKHMDKALEVWRTDGEIDALYNSLFRELLTYMMEDPRNIGFCTHLLFTAKNIERLGDHATNIAEIVYFMVTGASLPTDRPKGPSTEATTLASVEVDA